MPHVCPRRLRQVLIPLVAILFLMPEPGPAQNVTPGSWCVLRRHSMFDPPSCYEFFLCDTKRDVQRCGLAGNGCGVGPMGLREGWEVDPNAHPQQAPGPYESWQGGDYVMSVLSRFGGDWYQCRGPRTLDLPRRTPVGGGPSEPGYCVLSKPIPNWPPNCYEFYLAAAGAGRVVIQNNMCLVTTQAAREGWLVDASMGGPFAQRGQAQAAHDRLNRFAGNFYGCSEGPDPNRGGPFDPLGRSWSVNEGEGLRYGATFIRINNSNVFAATFDGHQDPSNRVMISIDGARVIMHRDQAPLAGDRVGRRQCTYQGNLFSSPGSQDPDMAEGTLDCNFFDQYGIRHNIPWRARISGQRGQ